MVFATGMFSNEDKHFLSEAVYLREEMIAPSVGP